MRKSKVLAAAALLFGVTMSTAAPAMAMPADHARSPAPATAPAAPQAPPLTSDKTTVRAGDTVHLKLDHGMEAVTYISSGAFVRDVEHPMGAPEGLARMGHDQNGVAEATATIADVPPGTYDVHARVGGGSVPAMKLTVVR